MRRVSDGAETDDALVVERDNGDRVKTDRRPERTPALVIGVVAADLASAGTSAYRARWRVRIVSSAP